MNHNARFQVIDNYSEHQISCQKIIFMDSKCFLVGILTDFRSTFWKPRFKNLIEFHLQKLRKPRFKNLTEFQLQKLWKPRFKKSYRISITEIAETTL